MKRALLLAWALALAAEGLAQESRSYNPIGRPAPQAPGAAAAPAAAPRLVAPATPAVRDSVMRTVELLAKTWNTPQLRALLSPGFYDRERLLEALATRVPRDAVLRILGVQAVNVLSQEVRPAANGIEEEVVTRVSVTLRTQVEFNDPVAGFRRLEGLNEALIVFREVR
jgi:hypothetical protein